MRRSAQALSVDKVFQLFMLLNEFNHQVIDFGGILRITVSLSPARRMPEESTGRFSSTSAKAVRESKTRAKIAGHPHQLGLKIADAGKIERNHLTTAQFKN